MGKVAAEVKRLGRACHGSGLPPLTGASVDCRACGLCVARGESEEGRRRRRRRRWRRAAHLGDAYGAHADLDEALPLVVGGQHHLRAQ